MRKRKEERNGETKGERERERERSIGTTCTCIMRKRYTCSHAHTRRAMYGDAHLFYIESLCYPILMMILRMN